MKRFGIAFVNVLLFIMAVLIVRPDSAHAATCSPATTQGTAPASWQTYCWLDFSTYNDTTARTAGGQNFSYTLSDGATLTFTVRTSGPGITSIAAPSWTGAAVGNTAFIGIPGRPVLYQTGAGSTVITISNILITPPPGAGAVTAYAVVAADGESTNSGETLSFTTNGSGWTILDQVDPISGNTYPTISGTGTSTFTETGVAGTVGGYIVGSNSPTAVSSTLVGSGLQGAMFAVRFASLRLNKVISGTRVYAADQFKFDITETSGGTLLGTGTSSGTGLGPFTAAAVSLASGIPITVSESMAAGSASTLSQYVSRLNCINSTSGSSTALPSNVLTTTYNIGALQFGDAVICTFTNTPQPHLRLQKAMGGTGRIFATDQFTMNITTGSTTVATTTTSGTGTTVTNGATALTQVTPSTAYSMSEAASGTTFLPQYNATIACTNANPGSSTTLPTTLPGAITPVIGDVITCTITNTRLGANALLTVSKTSQLVSDPSNGTINPKAIPGAVVRYSITVTNTGTLPVDASTIFIDDPLPATLNYDGSTAVTFTNGSVVSGLTFNAGTDVRFSNLAATPSSLASCTYTPSAGFDPAVRHVCIRPSGTMAGATVAGQPSFTVTFQTQIK